MKILIVDDDEDLRNLLAHYLVQEWPDLEIEQFDPLQREMPDASFALAAYDAVILDYMLGRGDGLDWLQQFKARADCPPVLFLTGAGNEVIAVQDPLLVNVSQSEHELAKEPQRLIRAERLAAEPPVEIAAVEEFHHQVGMLPGRALPLDARHVPAADARDQPVFLDETRERLLVSRHPAAQDLDHQRLVVALARREVNA